MDVLPPLVVRPNGASINRRTVTNVRLAGLRIDHVMDLDKMGMFKLIFASPIRQVYFRIPLGEHHEQEASIKNCDSRNL